MSDRPWHKHYHADALNGMAGLSVELRGVYYTILDLIYDAGGPVQSSDQMWAARMCCSVRKWKSYRDSLINLGKISFTSDGRLTNKRAEKELTYHQDRAKSGRKGGSKRAENALKTSRKRAENELKTDWECSENSEKPNENNVSDDFSFKQRGKPQKPETRSQNITTLSNDSVVMRDAPAHGHDLRDIDASDDSPDSQTTDASLVTHAGDLIREAAEGAVSPVATDLVQLIGLLSPGDGPPCDLHLDILPTLKARAQAMEARNDQPRRAYAYFRQPCIEARDARLAGAPAPRPVASGHGQPERFRRGPTAGEYLRSLQHGEESDRGYPADGFARGCGAEIIDMPSPVAARGGR